MGNLKMYNQLVGVGKNGRFLQFNPYKKVFNDINKKINITKQDIMLDLGGGCGEITKLISKECNTIVLSDGAEKAIEYAKNKLEKYNNISYKIADVTKLPLPFSDNQFDKIVCYSVIQYIDGARGLHDLIVDLLRITKSNGKIFIGDIPLREKYRFNLEERKKYPIKNFLLNQKYYFKRYAIKCMHKIRKIDTTEIKGTDYTKNEIENMLNKFSNIKYKFLEQDKQLIFSNSREDLIITKF
ncbi:MAG: class I SAM-dependent methyltransferase [Candidatus Falkowbacteria bacterium]